STETNGDATSPRCRRSQTAVTALVMGKCECENHAAVNQRDNMQTAPTKDASCAPINLIAQQIRNSHPEQASENEQISEYRYEETASLGAQEGGVEQGLSGEQRKR